MDILQCSERFNALIFGKPIPYKKSDNTSPFPPRLLDTPLHKEKHTLFLACLLE